MTLEEFKKKNIPGKRKSVISQFRDEVLQLKSDGYTTKQIQKYLYDNNVETGLRNVHYYIARELKRERKNNESA